MAHYDRGFTRTTAQLGGLERGLNGNGVFPWESEVYKWDTVVGIPLNHLGGNSQDFSGEVSKDGQPPTHLLLRRIEFPDNGESRISYMLKFLQSTSQGTQYPTLENGMKISPDQPYSIPKGPVVYDSGLVFYNERVAYVDIRESIKQQK